MPERPHGHRTLRYLQCVTSAVGAQRTTRNALSWGNIMIVIYVCTLCIVYTMVFGGLVLAGPTIRLYAVPCEFIGADRRRVVEATWPGHLFINRMRAIALPPMLPINQAYID